MDSLAAAEAKADMFKALGHPTRLIMVEALAERPHCVCELVAIAPGAQATISRHLTVLLRAGVVRRHKEGLKMIYELALPCILQALSCVRDALKLRLAAEQARLQDE